MKPGRLYGCGMAKGGLHPSFLPSGSVDVDGDCSFPAKLFPGASTLFVRISCDLNTFSALDSCDNLWVWSMNDRLGFPLIPTILAAQPTHQVGGKFGDCSTGQDFVTAVNGDGDVFVLGKCRHVQKNLKNIGIFQGKLDCFQLILPPELLSRGGAMVCEACNKSIALLSKDGTLWVVTDDGIEWLSVISAPVRSVSLGSLFGAAVSDDGKQLWVWGDGMSGNFGVGKRICSKEPIEVGEYFRSRHLCIAEAKCTRGQPGCKRAEKPTAGQEGPRIHVVTTDGALYIAGTSHKGLCADHFGKVMAPAKDQLVFYRVGSSAQDAPARAKEAPPLARGVAKSSGPPSLHSCSGMLALTGAAEDLLRTNIPWQCSEAEAYARMGMRPDSGAFGTAKETGGGWGCKIMVDVQKLAS